MGIQTLVPTPNASSTRTSGAIARRVQRAIEMRRKVGTGRFQRPAAARSETPQPRADQRVAAASR